MTMKIVGARESNFTGRDGTVVEGYMVSLTSPVPEGQGKGVNAESHYVTKAKLDSWGIDIIASVGQPAEVFLSRHNGKTSIVGISLKH